LISEIASAKSGQKRQNKLSYEIEKAIMKMRKKSHNLVAFFYYKNKRPDASNIQSPDTRTEPHCQSLK